MSTHTEQPPVQQPSEPEVPHDDHTGAFGFFRKYQKLILYTAGIFALITFSITGAMTDFFGQLTQRDDSVPDKITVEDTQVEITPEDVRVAGLLERYMGSLPQVVPFTVRGRDGSNMTTRLAILRRASIVEGLDVSMDEVDRAIDYHVRTFNSRFEANDTASQLALRNRFTSLAQYRELTKEAMRIGNYMLLQSVGVDVSDKILMDTLLRDKEKLTAKVATFDMKALEESLESSNPVDRAALDVVEQWEGRPGGRQVLDAAPRGIDRAAPALTTSLEHELRAWEQGVLDLVREQAGDRVTIARRLSTGINGVGVALMVAVFSQTGGITGGEAAVAGGTAAVSQAVLTAVFGEQAVRDLARDARQNLIGRLERLLETDRARFDELLGAVDGASDALAAALFEVEASRT